MRSLSNSINSRVVVFGVVLVCVFCSAAAGDANLVGWWKFDEGQGDMAYDSAGENDGTVYGATWTNGQIEGALSFDGVDDYIHVAHSPDFDIETSFTIALWFKAKPTQLSPDGLFAVIDKSHRSTESPPYWSGWIMQGRADIHGQLWFGIGNGADFPGAGTNKNTLDDVWHHIVGLFDGSNVIVYLDTVFQGSAGFSGTPVNNTGSLNIGRWSIGATRNFNGLVDEVRIYDRALSAEEILQLYEGGFGTAFSPCPSDGATGMELDVMLCWMPGTYATSHDVYFGTDFDGVKEASTSSGEYKGNQDANSYDPGLLDLDTTYYWRIDEVDAGGTVYKGEVWSFTTGDGIARNPKPSDGATDVDPNTILSWSAGTGAVYHDVYFGTDKDDINDANTSTTGIYRVRLGLGATTYDPPEKLEPYETYYWRIDEFGPSGTITGEVWSFTTAFYVTVPDTLDLQYRARLGINALTRCTNPSEGYRVYWLGELNRKPPILTWPYSSSLSNLYGKFTQSLALCRMATRSTFNTACDIAWKNTITNLFDPGPGPSVTPGVDGGRILATLAHYYSDDENSTWLTYAQSMVDRSVSEFYDYGDWGYFGGSMGWEATFHGWILQGLAHYYNVSGDSTTYTMGNKVANFLKSHAQVFDSNGHFRAKHPSEAGPAFHFHHNGNCMEALSEWVLASGDATLASFVNGSYQYAKSVSWPVIGFFPEYINGEYPDWGRRGIIEDCEACCVYDMMLTALNLTRSGSYDYWDDLDMYTRNMNANMQMTNGRWIYDMIAGYGEQGVPGGATDANVPERVVGDVAGWSPVNGFVASWSWSESVMHCCLGNAGRAWYHVWANILSYDLVTNSLAVNLLLNRFSEYADVASFLPYEGRVVIDVKQVLDDLSVRIPGYVNLATVQCTVNGQTKNASWEGRYLQIGSVSGGDAIIITFGISERPEQITVAGISYDLIIRGHTCVSIDPPGTYYPYFEGEHYRTGPVQYKRVARVIGKDISDVKYATIQKAINAAVDGDVIIVEPGVYQKNINFNGKRVTVRSTDPSDPAVVAATVINGGGKGSSVTFSSGEDANCVLAGLTITGGGNGDGEAGVLCLGQDVRPTIRNCMVVRNAGIGIYCGDQDSPSSPTISNCLIAGNGGAGIKKMGKQAATVTNCTIVENGAGGVDRNRGIATITNCAIWGNNGDAIYGGSKGVTYCNVEGGLEGEGNIDADPCFVQLGIGYWDDNNTPDNIRDDFWVWVDGDYHLQESSPCIDTGDPNYVPEPNETDLDGRPRVLDGNEDGTAVVDMGAYEFEFLSAVEAVVKIRPRTLNLASKGKWIMCVIRLPEDCNVGDIEPNSILLEDEVPAERVWLGDEFAVAKFSRGAVKEMLTELETPAEVELLVSGELSDGTIFEGADTIRVIDVGGGKNNDPPGKALKQLNRNRKRTKGP